MEDLGGRLLTLEGCGLEGVSQRRFFGVVSSSEAAAPLVRVVFGYVFLGLGAPGFGEEKFACLLT